MLIYNVFYKEKKKPGNGFPCTIPISILSNHSRFHFYTLICSYPVFVVQCYAPYKIIGYKIILPYFGQKNAKIIDPTFFPSHTVYYVYCML